MVREIKVFQLLSLAIVATLFLSCLGSGLYAQGKGNGNGGGGGGKGGTSTLSYQIVRLSTVNDVGQTLSGTARDVNSSLFSIGDVLTEDESGIWTEAVCWTVSEGSGGVESQLHYLDQGPFNQSQAWSCNEWGTIAGTVGEEHAVVWQDWSAVPDLLPGPFAVSHALAINNQSIVCGRGTDSTGAQAVVWSLVGGVWKHFVLPPQGDPGLGEDGLPLPNVSVANDISDEDPVTGLLTIVGRSNGAAAIWNVSLDDAGEVALGSSTILDEDSEAVGLNVFGAACGWTLASSSDGGDGVVWSADGTATMLPQLYEGKPARAVQSWPSDINDEGLIVGDASFEAIVWPAQDASPISLNDFLPKHNSNFFQSLIQANAVSSLGDVVGLGSFGEGGLLLPYLAIRGQ